MSDRLIPEELHNSLQGFLRAMFLHPEVGGELHQAAGSLFDALSALAPASSERAAAGEAGFQRGQRVAVLLELDSDGMDAHTPISVQFVGTSTYTGIWPEVLHAAVQAALPPAPAVAE